MMCLKFKEEITNPSTLVNLINDDFGIAFELSLITSNIKKERKAHNMSLMLDLRFKSLHLVSYFAG